MTCFTIYPPSVSRLQTSSSVKTVGLSFRATATCTSLTERRGWMRRIAAGTGTPTWSASSPRRSRTLSTVSSWCDLLVYNGDGGVERIGQSSNQSQHFIFPQQQMRRTTSGLAWMTRRWKMTSAGRTALHWWVGTLHWRVSGVGWEWKLLTCLSSNPLQTELCLLVDLHSLFSVLFLIQ